MHTFAPNDRIRIHHHGGFDGDIIIYDKKQDVEIRLDSSDLLDFIASRYVIPQIEEILEREDSKILVFLVPILQKLLKDEKT